MLEQAVKELHKRKKQIATEIGRLETEAKKLGLAIAALARLDGAGVPQPTKKKRTLSAAARKKIAAFQKARWAKIKAKKK